MGGFTKLFSTLLTSTVWCEDSDTKVVWITMLALVNRDGVVEASVPGLAKLSQVSIPAVEAALKKLSSPDKYSRTQEHEGRRIREIPGGWFVLNAAKYREMGRSTDRADYMASKQRESRARKEAKRLASCQHMSTIVNRDQPIAEAEAEAEEEKIPEKDLSGSSDRSTARPDRIANQNPLARSGPDKSAAHEGESPAFQEFYAAYPRREKRTAAHAAWRALKLDGNPDLVSEVMAALAKRKAWYAVQNLPAKFIPMPASWLNGKRWTDEVSETSARPKAVGHSMGSAAHEHAHGKVDLDAFLNRKGA